MCQSILVKDGSESDKDDIKQIKFDAIKIFGKFVECQVITIK